MTGGTYSTGDAVFALVSLKVLQRFLIEFAEFLDNILADVAVVFLDLASHL